MTVSSIVPVNNYAGNNSATKFDFDFYIENEEELLVQHTNKAGYQTTLKLNTDYTISKIGSENGGYIIFPAQDSSYKVLQEDELITLSLNLKIVQEKEFKNSSKLNLNMLENALDYVTRLIQILNRKMERAVKVKEGINVAPDKLMENINDAVNQSLTYSTYSEDSSKTAQKSAELAKNWAVKDNDKVENIDYSSKYYAQKSKASAVISEEKAQETNQTYLTAKEDIENKKSEFINEIEQEGDKQFKRIQSMGFYQKNGRFFYLNELGEETSIRFDKIDNLFDVVQKDHQLTYSETKGLALLGSYVYKESHDSGRYAYPVFYEKCLQEFNEVEEFSEEVEGVPIKVHPNGHKYYKCKGYKKVYNYPAKYGNITCENGIVSGFSSTSWGKIEKAFSPSGNWEICLKVNITELNKLQFIITSNVSYQAIAIGIKNTNIIYANSYKGDKNTSLFELNLTKPIEQTGIYYIILKFDQETGYRLEVRNHLKEIFEVVINEIKTNITTGQELAFGCDMSGKDVYYQYDFSGSIDIKESYIKDGDEYYWQGAQSAKNADNKAIIDDLYNKTGIAWYYGVDEENERILLPRNDYFFQNYKQIGKHIEAGLPNIIGTVRSRENSLPGADGAFSLSGSNGTNSYHTNGNSGDMRSIISFDASKSNPIYGNSNTVQPPSVGVYTYMVVGNTTLPQAQIEITEITTSENDTIPLFTGQYFDFKPNHICWAKADTEISGKIYVSAYNELVNIENGSITKYGSNFKVIKESDKLPDVDYSLYWIINTDNQTFKTPLKTSFLNTTAGLYFKVGNAVENQQIINCGEVLEELNNKISKTECKSYITETYINGTSGYRLWSDGWCEQWGRLITNSNTAYTVSLLKEMKDTNYICLNTRGVSGIFQQNIYGTHDSEPFNFTKASFDVYGHYSNGLNVIQWKVEGYV